MQKLAVLSDIHGNIFALEAVAADLSARRIDVVLTLGDHVSGPLWPRETAGYLMRSSWVHIAGNHERQLLEADPARMGQSDRYARTALEKAQLAWLASLPAMHRLNGDALAFHGSPGNDREYLLETIEHGRVRLASLEEVRSRLGKERAPLMLCGHTHVPRVADVGGSLIVNPGSVGCPAYDDDQPTYHIVETGSPRARYAIVEPFGDGWRADLVSVPYDHETAAGRADRNGRPDWAIALRTGFMRS